MAEKMYLQKMRTCTGLRLRPRSDFQPFLGFLNRAILSERGPGDAWIENVVERRPRFKRPATPPSSQRGRQRIDTIEKVVKVVAIVQQRSAVETAGRRLGEWTYAREKRNLGSAIIKGFVRPMEADGVDYARSMTAWQELWWFLTSEHPEVLGRIGRCNWCGRFFYRYTRKTKSCSPLCRLAPSLVLHPNPKLRTRLKEVLLPFAEQARNKPSTPTLARISKVVIPHFLGVIHRQNRRPFVFPQDVSDPAAFIAVWEFLFGEVGTLCGRMRRCEVCQELLYAYRPSQGTCGRECQMRRYHQRRRARRKVGTSIGRAK